MAAAALAAHEGHWSVSLRHVDRRCTDGYAWPGEGSLDETEILGILMPLTAADIQNVPEIEGHGHRSQQIDRIEEHAQLRIASLELQKRQLLEADLYRFALGFRERIWGFILDHVFYPLWWDPEHRVCGFSEDYVEPTMTPPATVVHAAGVITRRRADPTDG